jgi:hypothetical protein
VHLQGPLRLRLDGLRPLLKIADGLQEAGVLRHRQKSLERLPQHGTAPGARFAGVTA